MMLWHHILSCFGLWNLPTYSIFLADPRGKPLNILKNQILVTARPGYARGTPTHKAISKELDYKSMPAIWIVCPCDVSSALVFETSGCFCVQYLNTQGLQFSLSSDTAFGAWASFLWDMAGSLSEMPFSQLPSVASVCGAQPLSEGRSVHTWLPHFVKV